MLDKKIFRNFLIIWIGELISSIGSGITAFALGVYIYQRTNSATYFALTTLCAFLPSILLSPFGGVVVDRFDRRLMMIIGDLGSATGILFIFLWIKSGNTGILELYLGIISSSIFVALQSPAYKSSVTDLIHSDDYSKASGLVQLAESSKFLISPIIAGMLMSITTINKILIIDMSTFIIAIVAVFFVKKKLPKEIIENKQQHFFMDLKEGANAVFSNKGVVILISIISILTFYIGLLQTLFAPMILSITNAKNLGIMQSVSAMGMLFTSLFIGVFSKGKSLIKILILGMIFAGITFLFIGLRPNIYLITLACFMFFCALPFINTSCDVIIRKNIDNKLQGRVWGIIAITSQLGFVVAYSISGILADYVFNPMFVKGGFFADSIGHIIGTGAGRGIGFLFICSGIFIVILAFIASRFKILYLLEKNK